MDRTLWARFGEATLKAPHAIQWLSDNGPQYTATASVLYAHELGLVPITTPAYSPESNGLTEAFVKTFQHGGLRGRRCATRGIECQTSRSACTAPNQGIVAPLHFAFRSPPRPPLISPGIGCRRPTIARNGPWRSSARASRAPSRARTCIPRIAVKTSDPIAERRKHKRPFSERPPRGRYSTASHAGLAGCWRPPSAAPSERASFRA